MTCRPLVSRWCKDGKAVRSQAPEVYARRRESFEALDGSIKELVNPARRSERRMLRPHNLQPRPSGYVQGLPTSRNMTDPVKSAMTGRCTMGQPWEVPPEFVRRPQPEPPRTLAGALVGFLVSLAIVMVIVSVLAVWMVRNVAEHRREVQGCEARHERYLAATTSAEQQRLYTIWQNCLARY